MIELELTSDLGDFSLAAKLSLPEQGITAIFGESGSGKTTLLRCVAGLQKMQGRLSVNNEVWQDDTFLIPTHQRPLAYVFQEASLFSHLSVRKNLEYGYKRTPKSERRIAFDEAVEWLGLKALLDRHPSKLSGGQRQRVAIARALLTSPRLLLMDEPLSALDQSSKNEIMPYLEKLRDTLSIPILYVTHSLDEVARLADYLVLLKAGTVLASGVLSDVLSRLDLPIHQKEELGVVLKTTVVERDKKWHLLRVEFEGGGLWVRDSDVAIGKQLRVRVLARDVSIALEHQENTSILNLLPATIKQVVDNEHPAVKLVQVKIGGTTLLSRVTTRSVDVLGLKQGGKVWLQIKSVAVLE